MNTIDLHGYSAAEAQLRLELHLLNALKHGERLVRIIHGQGKHSEHFPVIKSQVRRWLTESPFAREHIRLVYRGEDGSPYTLPNAGETIVELVNDDAPPSRQPALDFDEEEEREARRNAKALRSDRLRTARRRPPTRR
ncbi:Smr domain-containing protein [Hydrogenispora ethanolica]|uniref:Smr domain-containing protein n=1 Tax=Hydrogenispora ethanolica TaxID=1082276 RepID=A0A4R1S039_HYDET|nr:Smr/MutS family protein [Hydrogenispora ethanolica]TCL72426.1 Smr domain-containing protein [Hydrogenispora ethanolica]